MNPFSLTWLQLDMVSISGMIVPGISRISGAAIKRDMDKKKGKGTSGATVTYTGDDLSEFELEVTLWLPEHFEIWNNAIDSLLKSPPAGKKPKALEIEHPILADLGISAVLVTELGQWTVDEKFVWTRKIKFTQFRAPKPSSGTPKGAAKSSGADSGGKGDQVDPEIDALRRQSQNTWDK